MQAIVFDFSTVVQSYSLWNITLINVIKGESKLKRKNIVKYTYVRIFHYMIKINFKENDEIISADIKIMCIIEILRVSNTI